jgi:hypothetical protein
MASPSVPSSTGSPPKTDANRIVAFNVRVGDRIVIRGDLLLVTRIQPISTTQGYQLNFTFVQGYAMAFPEDLLLHVIREAA